MAYYTNLINAWNLSSASAVVPPGVTGESLFGLPTSAKLDILNDWTVLSTTERDDVEVKDVLVYLFTQNKYPQLKNYINTAVSTIRLGYYATSVLSSIGYDSGNPGRIVARRIG